MKYILRNENQILHYIMTFTGGFMGLYAICAYGNFGSAQTGNLMSMIIDLAGGDGYDFLVRAGAFFLFALGIAVSYLLKRFTSLPMRALCLAVDAAALVVSAGMPERIYPFFRLYPLFMATSFQWGTFGGVGTYGSASLFLTGNMKSCVLGWTEYLIDHDREAWTRARFYTVTILSYLIGGFMGCESVICFGAAGGYAGMLPLLAAGWILYASSRRDVLHIAT